MNYLSTIDIVILCGGFGKRLKSVLKDKPKPMAEIGHRPFLDILIDFVASFGFKHFILCTGYRSEIIERYFKQKNDDLNIEFSKEQEPLGTGGAIKKAEGYIKSDPFLVMNGDSFCRIDLNKFIKFHQNKKSLISMAVTAAQDNNNNDYGVIALDDSQRIIEFCEKPKGYKDSFINTGIYFFKKEILSLMPKYKSFSLENDFFNIFLNKELYGYITPEILIDIGTPERYERAKQFFAKNITWEM